MLKENEAKRYLMQINQLKNEHVQIFDKQIGDNRCIRVTELYKQISTNPSKCDNEQINNLLCKCDSFLDIINYYENLELLYNEAPWQIKQNIEAASKLQKEIKDIANSIDWNATI